MSGGMSLSCSSRHTSWGGGRVSRHIFLTLLDLFPRHIFWIFFPPNLFLSLPAKSFATMDIWRESRFAAYHIKHSSPPAPSSTLDDNYCDEIGCRCSDKAWCSESIIVFTNKFNIA